MVQEQVASRVGAKAFFPRRIDGNARRPQTMEDERKKVERGGAGEQRLCIHAGGYGSATRRTQRQHSAVSGSGGKEGEAQRRRSRHGSYRAATPQMMMPEVS